MHSSIEKWVRMRKRIREMTEAAEILYAAAEGAPVPEKLRPVSNKELAIGNLVWRQRLSGNYQWVFFGGPLAFKQNRDYFHCEGYLYDRKTLFVEVKEETDE